MVVYDSYTCSLLLRVHAGQQFVCGSKIDTASLNALILIVLMLTSTLRSMMHFSYVLFAPVPFNCLVVLIFRS